MNLSNTDTNNIALQSQPRTPPSNNFKDNHDINSSERTAQNNTDTEANSKKKKSIVRARFAPQEDKEILQLVSIYGDRDWNKISSEIAKISNDFIQKTPRQCRDRYVNYLNPNINKAEWTLEEDQCLIHNFMITQPRFESMKQFFPGRSQAAIKNRFKYLYKYGLGLLKSNINKDIQLKQANQPNSPINNMNNVFQDPNFNTNQFLNKFNVNFGPIYSKHVKSIVMDIFHNCPTVVVQDNHLIFNTNDGQTNQSETSTEEKDNRNEIFQSESDIDLFDPMFWFDTF